MLINPDEINKILNLVDTKTITVGKKLFEQSKIDINHVNYVSNKKYVIDATIYDKDGFYKARVNRKENLLNYHCTCKEASKKGAFCPHIVALIFDIFINSEKYINFVNKKVTEDDEIINSVYKSSDNNNEKSQNDNLISYYENLEFEKYTPLNMEIVPILKLTGFKNKELEVYFKVGKERKYILRDIYKFGNAMINNMEYSYGKLLSFRHNINAFSDSYKDIAEFVTKKAIEYNEFSKLGTYNFSLDKRYRGVLKLKYNVLDEFFGLMENKKVKIEGYYLDDDENEIITDIKFVDKDPEFNFEITEKEDEGLNIKRLENDYFVLPGSKTIYILYNNKLYRCSKRFREMAYKFLTIFNDVTEDNVNIEKMDATNFCEYVLPKITDILNININQDLIEKYKAKQLNVKVYLDIANNQDVICNVEFIYDDVSFNPFDDNLKITCNRNIVEETKTKEIFSKLKFLLDRKNKRLYIKNDEDIYNFLNSGINFFIQKFEVMATDKIKSKKVINLRKINVGVRIENDLLNIDFTNLDFDEKELVEILKNYNLKKKYYRLKDGSFVNMDSDGVNTMVSIARELNLSLKDFDGANIKVPKFRALYLDNILKNNNENIILSKDDSFKKIIKDIKNVNDISFTPKFNINRLLRSYQKTGYNWLKNLEYYGFGGILADDMGLGKTIQVIALLEDSVNNKIPSIVICPSSLYINWEKEIKKFAEDIKILVISGNANEREKLISKINSYDVVITSYDLLKRDIDSYEKKEFNYVIADEAQYIKNNNTKNAKALKKLKSKTRFALTGTPIENSLSELWSIFDFIMPGYLFSYKKFKEEFENPIIKDDDNNAKERLKKLVSPFILRRVKKEVLKELPDKTETIMYSKMEKEQEQIYMAYLKKAKKEMNEEISINGFEKSKLKILSLITRLRQICCHPSLFLDNYNGDSSKLNQCIEIIKDATNSGHKILLFSGFTSMFDIITKRLDENNIKYFMLTGKTKSDIRVEMVDKFNKSEDVKVFLISLKAGGTGLNLTGADMVIHYDPWWNLSAQNQATDRVYRIGQRSNVQVFKLITQNSIEEKILKLQDKKMDITNAIIKEGETFISKMSKEEILDLFEL